MNAPCYACLTGPAGISGHDDLMVQLVGDFRQLSRCRCCQSLWLRISNRAGQFTWSPAAEPVTGPGILVPPRSRARENA